ncbi:Uu.00g033050.m01.CDS01 [Anthostomella pinea]|uniref:Uu.00g033050.m01.CDS01 n=1 Tax=Anthostomella pinea TaxID=933095 RepID=A0AAI8V9A2_9PEZI|nr:Uu.00g033050.m01.CDS01 [Anthostomella pinea]
MRPSRPLFICLHTLIPSKVTGQIASLEDLNEPIARSSVAKGLTIRSVRVSGTGPLQDSARPLCEVSIFFHEQSHQSLYFVTEIARPRVHIAASHRHSSAFLNGNGSMSMDGGGASAILTTTTTTTTTIA